MAVSETGTSASVDKIDACDLAVAVAKVAVSDTASFCHLWSVIFCFYIPVVQRVP